MGTPSLSIKNEFLTTLKITFTVISPQVNPLKHIQTYDRVFRALEPEVAFLWDIQSLEKIPISEKFR